MKLSDAILLGSTLLRPTAGHALTGDGHGCAVGMALCAIGKATQGEYLLMGRNRLHGIWPWLRVGPVRCPCSCHFRRNSYLDAIIHLFDEHVAENGEWRRTERWSIERLTQWVASVDPPVEAEMAGQGPRVQTDMAIEAETQRVEHD